MIQCGRGQGLVCVGDRAGGQAAGHAYSAVSEPKELNVLEDSQLQAWKGSQVLHLLAAFQISIWIPVLLVFGR